MPSTTALLVRLDVPAETLAFRGRVQLPRRFCYRSGVGSLFLEKLLHGLYDLGVVAIPDSSPDAGNLVDLVESI